MSLHRVWLQTFPDQPGEQVVLTGDEAHHAARVKRLVAKDPLELIDGNGRIARATVVDTRKTSRHGWEIECRIEEVTTAPRVVPYLDVWTAVPKGDRLEQMVDGLSQVGAGGWAPLSCERSVVEPREGKLSRLHRVCDEACKQCGRAWTLQIGKGGTLDDALAERTAVVVADASGAAYSPQGMASIRLVVGPEGGWTPEELEMSRARGAIVASFGPHVLRIETAAVVAAAVVVQVEANAVPRTAGRANATASVR